MPDSALLTGVLSSAGAGTAIMVILWLCGLLYAKPSYDRVIHEADNWHTAYDAERTAHQATRDALVVANQRAEAAIETARVTKQLLDYIQQQRQKGAINGPDPQA